MPSQMADIPSASSMIPPSKIATIETKNDGNGSAKNKRVKKATNHDVPEFTEKYHVNYFGKTPIISKISKVIGICAFESCHEISKSGFCRNHRNQMFRALDFMARALNIRCQFPAGCHHVVHAASHDFCAHHQRVKYAKDVDLEDTPTTDEMKTVTDSIISKIVMLANSGIQYYIGQTLSLLTREGAHSSTLKLSPHIVCETLIECEGLEKSIRLEKLMIACCLLHPNPNVRNNILNESKLFFYSSSRLSTMRNLNSFFCELIKSVASQKNYIKLNS